MKAPLLATAIFASCIGLAAGSAAADPDHPTDPAANTVTSVNGVVCKLPTAPPQYSSAFESIACLFGWSPLPAGKVDAQKGADETPDGTAAKVPNDQVVTAPEPIRQEVVPDLADAPVECVMAVTSKGDNKTIDAIVKAKSDASGRFSLEIAKKGTNTIRSHRNGTFNLTAGQEQRIGTFTTNVGPMDVLNAAFNLKWNGGKAECKL